MMAEGPHERLDELARSVLDAGIEGRRLLGPGSLESRRFATGSGLGEIPGKDSFRSWRIDVLAVP